MKLLLFIFTIKPIAQIKIFSILLLIFYRISSFSFNPYHNTTRCELYDKSSYFRSTTRYLPQYTCCHATSTFVWTQYSTCKLLTKFVYFCMKVKNTLLVFKNFKCTHCCLVHDTIILKHSKVLGLDLLDRCCLTVDCFL